MNNLPAVAAFCISAFSWLEIVHGQEIPVRQFFKNPDTCYYRISPDGKLISYLSSSGPNRRLNIFIKRISDGAPTCVTSENDHNISTYFWKGDDNLIYPIGVVENGKWRTHIRCVDLKAKGNLVHDCTPVGYGGILDELPKIPNKILVGIWRAPTMPGAWAVADVCRLDIRSNGQTELVLKNPGDATGWATDRDGTIRGMITGDSVNQCFLTRKNASGPWHKVITANFREGFSQPTYNFGGRIFDVPSEPIGERESVLSVSRNRFGRDVIYALSRMDKASKKRDKIALVQIDPNTGKELREIYSNPDYDVSDIERSPGRGVVCAKYADWRNQRYYWDLPTAAIYRQLAYNFPGDDVDVCAYDRLETKLIVKRSSDRTPLEYYLFKPQTGYLKKLGDYAPQLKGHLAPIKAVSFKSRDQRTINAYLTLPLSREPTNLPLVVVPHGGPWWRNTWGFSRENEEVQFFANRGYAVLQLNFRASSGYGREFWECGFKKFGQEMENDIIDGVQWTIDTKVTDPNKVAIVGESYGGYAALAAIAFPQEKKPSFQFVAAVDRDGPSDLVDLVTYYKPQWIGPQFCQKVGDPDIPADKEMLARYSPALHYDQINTPLLIAHGQYDGIVLPSQSQKIYDNLFALKKDVQFLPIANENHIFENEESLFAYYEAVDAFLKKHLN